MTKISIQFANLFGNPHPNLLPQGEGTGARSDMTRIITYSRSRCTTLLPMGEELKMKVIVRGET